jgi:hypothetical protein
MKVRLSKIAALAAATVLIASSPVAAQTYEWVLTRPGDCQAQDMAAPEQVRTNPPTPREGYCNSSNEKKVAVCWDRTPSYPLPAGISIPACAYKNVDLQGCTGGSPGSNGMIFVCTKK